MSKLLYITCVILVGACSSPHEKYDSATAINKFYQVAKSRESEMSLLFNVTLRARGLNDDGTFYIPTIEYTFSETKTIILPVINQRQSRTDIEKSDAYANVKEYASMQNLTESEVFEYTSNVVKLVNELHIGDVQSTPRLGRFIIFNVSDIDEVVYIPDTSKVNHSYWQKFFKTEKKFDDHWYYKQQKRIKHPINF